MHKIFSRKITTFRTQFIHENSNLKDVAQLFVSNVKSNIPAIGVEEIYNANESSFNLEIHFIFERTLAKSGIKIVEAMIQSYLLQHIVTLSCRLFLQVDLFFHHYI